VSFSTEAPEAYPQGDSHPSAKSTCALALLKHTTLHMTSTFFKFRSNWPVCWYCLYA